MDVHALCLSSPSIISFEIFTVTDYIALLQYADIAVKMLYVQR